MINEPTTFMLEIKGFFDAYIAAFAREDASSIAGMWDDVGLFPSPTGNFSMNRKEFHKHCETLLNFYRTMGVVNPTGALLSVEELFPNVALARMAYRALGAGEAVVASWEHVYILRKTDQRWRVSWTIADDEIATWSAVEAQS